jgi:hypothetical protein
MTLRPHEVPEVFQLFAHPSWIGRGNAGSRLSGTLSWPRGPSCAIRRMTAIKVTQNRMTFSGSQSLAPTEPDGRSVI